MIRLLIAALSVLASTSLLASPKTQQVRITMGGKPLANQELELIKLDDSGQLTEALKKNSNAKGIATFSLNKSDSTIVARSNYQGVTYFSEMFRVGYPLPLEIYAHPSTRDDVQLQVEDTRLFISSVEEGIVVSQQFVVINPSTKTFLGKGEGQKAETFRFSIPSSAFDLERGVGIDADSARIENNDIILSTPLIPGRTLFALSYKMEKKRGAVNFKQKLSAPVDQISMGIATSGVKPSFASEAVLSSKYFDRNLIATYSMIFPKPVSELDFRISGLPLQIRFSHWLPLMLFVILLIAVIVFSRRNLTPTSSGFNRKSLLEELKALETIKTQRLIEDSEYQLRRLLLIEKLWSSDDRP
jgi:hypothetical protein